MRRSAWSAPGTATASAWPPGSAPLMPKTRVCRRSQRTTVATAAGRAEPAADHAGAQHAVARAEVAHPAPHLDDLAHELVADGEAGLGHGQVAVIEVEVRAADRGALSAEQGAVRIGRRPVRSALAADVALPVEGEGAHRHDGAPGSCFVNWAMSK